MNKKFTPTLHDAIFKQFLSEKETAKDFFDIWLPDEIRALCDLDSLKVESGSFIDSEMKNYQSDILYSVNTQQGQGYVYLLIEPNPPLISSLRGDSCAIALQLCRNI